MKQITIGRAVAGCAIGLALALLTPFLLPFSVILSVLTVALILLFVYFGPVSALFAAVACGASAWSLFGAIGLYALLFVGVAPALAGALLLRRQAAYPLRMKVAVGAQVLGAAAFLLAAQLIVGGNLADALTESIYDQVSAMPAGFADYYLAMLGVIEMPSGGFNLYNGVLEAAEREALMRSALEAQNLALKVSLPPMLVSSCLYTGILACHMPSAALARQGGDGEHMALSKWRIGRELTILAALVFVTGLYFLLFNRSDAAAPAYYTLQSIAGIVFSMQGLAAMDRMLLRAGHSRAWRRVALAGLLVLSFTGVSALALIGFASAMWGSEGIITLRRKRRQGGDHDDNDEGEL